MPPIVPQGYAQAPSGLLVPTNLDLRAQDRGGDASPLQTPSAWLTDTLRGARTLAGTAISPASALTITAYFACIRNLSEDIAKLPLLTYKRLARGKERAYDHPHYRLLSITPNKDQASMTFRETLMQYIMSYGNGYAEIVWDPYTGYAKELWPIHPSRVRITNLKDEGLCYRVRSNWSQWMGGVEPFDYVVLPAKDVLHIRGLGSEGMYGYSVAQLAAESLGLTLATENFGSAFFGNGTWLGGVLEHPQKLSKEALEHLRESWQGKYQGPENAGKPAILEEGMKWVQLGIPPEDAQFLSTREFQTEEVCRWFRMPPHKIGHARGGSARTGSSIEQQNIEYVTDSILPWLIRFEQELRRKLFLAIDDEEHFCEHLLQSLMRGDAVSRATYYKDMFGIGVLSLNEIRELENMNDVEFGDERFVATNNLQPLRLAVQGQTPNAPAPPGGTPAKPGRGEPSQPETPVDYPSGWLQRNGNGYTNGVHHKEEEPVDV